MTEKSEDQVVWILSNWSTGEKLLQTNNYPDVHKYMCEEGKDKSIRCDKYIHDSKYLALKSDLAVAVEALERIEDDLMPGDLYEGSTPYTEMFWAAQRLAKEALGKIGDLAEPLGNSEQIKDREFWIFKTANWIYAYDDIENAKAMSKNLGSKPIHVKEVKEEPTKKALIECPKCQEEWDIRYDSCSGCVYTPLEPTEHSKPELSMSMFATKEAYNEALKKSQSPNPLDELEEYAQKHLNKIKEDMKDETIIEYGYNALDRARVIYEGVLSKIRSLRGE